MDNFEYDYDEETKTLEPKHEPKSPFLAMIGTWGLFGAGIGLVMVFPLLALIIGSIFLIHKYG